MVIEMGVSMKTRASLAFASILLVPSVAHADDITISPRLWLVVDALSADSDQGGTGQSTGQVASFTSKPFIVPMIGGSIAYRSDSFLPKTTFTVTALFGSDNSLLTTRGSEIQQVTGTVLVNGQPTTETRQSLVSNEQRTPERLRRRDFELTAQTRMNDLLSWMVGVRYERARVRFTPTVTTISTNPFNGVVTVDTRTFSSFMGGYDLYSARAGMAFVAPLNENRTDLLYANGMAFIGRRINKDHQAAAQYDDATFIGPDLTVGYAHRFGGNVSLDLRYRAQFFFSIGGAGRFGEPKNSHGPSVAVAYTF
jgi:hypothetical protein